MRKLIYGFLFIGFFHLAYGFFVSFWRPPVYSQIVTPSNQLKFYDYAGAFNVKTTKSSGSGDLDEITLAAHDSALTFVIVTDFNNFSINPNERPYLNNIFVFNGGEYSYLDSRIYNYDMRTTDHLQGPGRSQIAFADLLSESSPQRPEGTFILSQPLGREFSGKDQYPIGISGLEIINLKQIWQYTWLHSKFSFFWNIFVYPFNSNLAFVRMLATADQGAISVWDKLNQDRPTTGYFGNAAEANMRLPGKMFIKFPSYKTLFSIAKNHILLRSELTGNPSLDRAKISEALQRGQFYMSLDILQNPEGFSSYVSDDGGAQYLLGSELKYHPGQELVVNLPDKPELEFETAIYRNGEKVATSTSASTAFALHSPGTYRAAVKLKVPLPPPEGKKWLNWILTNPIYLN